MVKFIRQASTVFEAVVTEFTSLVLYTYSLLKFSSEAVVNDSVFHFVFYLVLYRVHD